MIEALIRKVVKEELEKDKIRRHTPNPQEIAKHIDADKIAECIEFQDIASRMCHESVAGHISIANIAGWIDMDKLAQAIVRVKFGLMAEKAREEDIPF